MRALVPLFCAPLLLTACSPPPPDEARPAGDVVLFEGARLIAGDGSPPLDDAALVVEGERIVAVGRRGEVRAPAGATRVDLTGRTVMPALVNLHGHLGYMKGTSFAAENYTRDTLIDHLNRYAYYGVGAVASLGTDAGDLALDLRAAQRAGTLGGALCLTAGRGLAAPDAGPGNAAMRGSAYGVASEEEARRNVQELAARKVDLVKVWVDDRGGTVQKLDPALYRAIIDEAHRHALQVVAHVFYLADAKDLVRAGVDGFAHLVRDLEVDDELVALMKERNVWVTPNLGLAERGRHAERPAWLDDPALRETVAPAVIERLGGTFATRDPAAVARSRDTYGRMERSLAKLTAAGVRIALGTDSGVQDHYYGYAELRELQLMVDAGMTPAQVLVAATRTPAEILRLAGHGTLAPGRSADFIVLDADPLEDMANVRRIANVYLRGRQVDRAALRAAWGGGSSH